jgi:hypothetical protein
MRAIGRLVAFGITARVQAKVGRHRIQDQRARQGALRPSCALVAVDEAVQLDACEHDSNGQNAPLNFGHVPEHRNQQRKQTLAGRPFQSCHKSCRSPVAVRSPGSSAAPFPLFTGEKTDPSRSCLSAWRMGSLISPLLFSASLSQARPRAHPPGESGSS